MSETTLFPLPKKSIRNDSSCTMKSTPVPHLSSICQVSSSHLALLLTHDEKTLERKHLTTLCERFGHAPPAKEADHLTANFDNFQLRWEQHGESSTYSFYTHDTPDDPFADPALKKYRWTGYQA